MKKYMQAAFICAAAIGSSQALADAYRCVGPDGKVAFQDKPCGQGTGSKETTIRAAPVPASPSPAAPVRGTWHVEGVPNTPWTPTVQDRTSQPQRTEAELKAKVAATLKDPDSAKFQGLQLVWSGRALCGEVNATNSYGGYVGFKAFVVDSQGVYFSGDSSTKADVGRKESRNTYYPKADFWGCLP